MPWCEACNRYLTPPTLEEDGTCPDCGTVLAEPEERHKVPWHFWVMVLAVTLYLGWRVVQGILWVLGKL
ncbi:MAG: hypothetical protein GEV08_06845 [Acidimicrobiia bacterium]|nr:hypothetical protein [Acidimicrobiia bacterium]